MRKLPEIGQRLVSISIEVSQILSKSEIYGAITAMRKLPEIRDQRSEDIISIILTVNKGWDLTIRKSDAGIIPSRICREDSAGTHGLPRISRRTHGLDENISLGHARQVDTVCFSSDREGATASGGDPRSCLSVEGLGRLTNEDKASIDSPGSSDQDTTRWDHLTGTRLSGIILPGRDLPGHSLGDGNQRDGSH